MPTITHKPTEQERGQLVKALIKKIDDQVHLTKTPTIESFERLVADLAELNAQINHPDGAEIPTDVFHGISNTLRCAMVSYWTIATIKTTRDAIQQNVDRQKSATHERN